MNISVTIIVIFLITFTIFFWVHYRNQFVKSTKKLISSKRLDKHHKNPVLSPKPYVDWQAGGTFNPAAFTDEHGRVHVIYRAVGADGVSRLGYTSSTDGFHFDDHEVHPVFSIEYPEDSINPRRYDRVLYPSGGSFGGCEDPRMVCIDERIYVTFSAFDNWGSIRIGVVSIHKQDLLNKRWKWSNVLLISPENSVNKNWVLFPEKINGKFAIIHSIVPEILIEYVDELNINTKPIESPRPDGPQPGRKDFWDNRIRGAGPPPIKTEKGWLLLYHACTDGDHRYKLGAMLLDLKNPSKIIARSKTPILTSENWYENDWKPGVVYACGAVVKDDVLHVYYGGGDKHMCVAQTSLSSLLEWMING
ncbi:MAG: glycoside hydrolase family 130 protein [Minisyncoccota bacterium]